MPSITSNEMNDIKEREWWRRGLIDWHTNNMNFKCHTIIYFLRKRPKEKVGGNFYWK